MNELRRFLLPYCLIRQPDGRYVCVNRDYKPLGFNTRDWVTYGNLPIAFTLPTLTAANAARISYKGSDDLDRIYLYNDGSVPTETPANMAAYLERLAILMRLKCA